MLNIQVVLFDGFDPMDAVAPYEVFCAAALFAGDDALSVELVTAEGPRSVVSGTNGLKLEATGRLDPERGGIILVPGASGRIEGEGPGTVPAILGRTLITPLTGLMRQAFERNGHGHRHGMRRLSAARHGRDAGRQAGGHASTGHARA